MYVSLGFQLLSVWSFVPNPPQIKSLVISLEHFQCLLSAITDSIYTAITSEKNTYFSIILDISWNSRTLEGRKFTKNLLKYYLSQPLLYVKILKIKITVLGQIVVEQRLMLINHMYL